MPGSDGWRKYFVDATVADNFGRPWSTQGQYVDNVLSTITNASGRSNGFTCFQPGCPVKYPTPESWSAAENGFANAIADAFASHGVPTITNRGLTSSPEGAAAWLALDRSVASGHAPVGQLEEGAFVTPWTSLGDVAFLSHVEWASQISTLSQIKHSKAIVLCHSNLVSTKTAVRNLSLIHI